MGESIKVAEYIPEMHDMGKLVDRKELKNEGVKFNNEDTSHTYVHFDFSSLTISKPTSATWYGQYHMDPGWNNLPRVDDQNKEYAVEVFLTKVADHLAASCTRVEERGGVPNEKGLYKLWKPSFYIEQELLGKKWAAVETAQELKEMFEFIDKAQNPADFFSKYGEHLRLTPEDKSVPNNTVSLYTHTELVGKMCRVLKGVERMTDDAQSYLKYDGKKVKSIYEAESQWKYRLLKFYVKFPQKMVRLQDLNVLKLRLKLIDKVIEKNYDNVLFSTDNFLCLFIPLDSKPEDVLSPILEKGFYCEGVEIETVLKELTTNLDRVIVDLKKKMNKGRLEELKKQGTKVFETSVYKSEDKIDPPLCDLCQMQTGKEIIKEQILEYLCDTCNAIRDMGEPLTALKNWSEEDAEAGWMKISLDQEHLLRVLTDLFNNYVDGEELIKKKDEAKASFRPLPLEVEFINDYRKMLKEFERLIYGLPDSQGNPIFSKESFLYPIETYKELAVFKVAGGEVVLHVIDTFLSVIRDFFPECIDDFPVKLYVSVSNIKYPFQQHWRFFEPGETIDEEQGRTINIQSPGNFVLGLSPVQYMALKDEFVRGGKSLSHFLHNLAEIEMKTKSSMAVMLEILKNRRQYLLKHGLQAQDVLNFFKLTRD